MHGGKSHEAEIIDKCSVALNQMVELHYDKVSSKIYEENLKLIILASPARCSPKRTWRDRLAQKQSPGLKYSLPTLEGIDQNIFHRVIFLIIIGVIFSPLTLTRLIGLPPHAPVAQRIADQRWLIANSAKNKYLFLYKMMWLKVG